MSGQRDTGREVAVIGGGARWWGAARYLKLIPLIGFWYFDEQRIPLAGRVCLSRRLKNERC